MKEKTILETNLETLRDSSWLYYEENEDIIFVENDETINKAAELWKMSPLAVKAIKDSIDGFVEYLVDTLSDDLKDLWNEIQEVKEENN